MEMSIEAFSDSVTKVVLNGRLDMQGAQKIDLPFSALAGSHRKVIVDLSQVVFMASMGIRTLVLTAKSIKSKGGRLILLDPVGAVEKVLVESGIDMIIPITHGLDAAIGAVNQ
jgi:stage II sporulation protein AA (anti-sigma F factor antagonist)